MSIWDEVSEKIKKGEADRLAEEENLKRFNLERFQKLNILRNQAIEELRKFAEEASKYFYCNGDTLYLNDSFLMANSPILTIGSFIYNGSFSDDDGHSYNWEEENIGIWCKEEAPRYYRTFQQPVCASKNVEEFKIGLAKLITELITERNLKI